MPIRAVFFDVGDTLVEGWATPERMRELAREVLRREFGERPWFDALLETEFRHDGTSEAFDIEETRLRQETVRWYAEWLANVEAGVDDVDADRLRVVVTVPLDLISKPVPGAFPAVRWCHDRDLTVVLVTNTHSRGDDEVWEDMRRLGIADAIDHVVSSHSTGWLKPHPRIFERALRTAGVAPRDAVMVGDRIDADIWGAARLGIRTVLRRMPGRRPSRIDVRPDAELDDLTALPATLERWLAA